MSASIHPIMKNMSRTFAEDVFISALSIVEKRLYSEATPEEAQWPRIAAEHPALIAGLMNAQAMFYAVHQLEASLERIEGSIANLAATLDGTESAADLMSEGSGRHA